MKLVEVGKHVFVFFIEIYQKMISPWLPSQCRFYPTCSNYSKMAFLKYGVFKGLYLTIRRLFRCHPFHPGGNDPLV